MRSHTRVTLAVRYTCGYPTAASLRAAIRLPTHYYDAFCADATGADQTDAVQWLDEGVKASATLRDWEAQESFCFYDNATLRIRLDPLDRCGTLIICGLATVSIALTAACACVCVSSLPLSHPLDTDCSPLQPYVVRAFGQSKEAHEIFDFLVATLSSLQVRM